MPILQLTVGTGDTFAVKTFEIHERMSDTFCVTLVAYSENESIDLEGVVGKPASFAIESGMKFATRGKRKWQGICSYAEQVHAEPTGLSTYALEIVPVMWVLTQRASHRLFQHVTIVDIVKVIFGELGVDAVWQLSETYLPLEYRVQYGESDYQFVCRLLEEAGIAFSFPDDGGTKLILSDAPTANPAFAGSPLSFVDNPNEASELEFVTHVQMAHGVRPGAFTMRDYDQRAPRFNLEARAATDATTELAYEQYAYVPGGFLVENQSGGATPVADDQGVARWAQAHGVERARLALEATRADKRHVVFVSNVIDLGAGTVFAIDKHPHAALTPATSLLTTEYHLRGSQHGNWTASGRALFADVPYRPPLRTPKPVVTGVQPAVVVGPKGEEIYVDELGRVRVQFPWDRDGKLDETANCWLRVSQGWAGTGFGMIDVPRIGQEVIVGFVGGNPDQPMVVGRLYNAVELVPYKLPDHKTRSTWKSRSSPQGAAENFNEIMFEDLMGQELVFEQAEKNRRRLVKHDEVVTVVHDLQKYVKNDEIETTVRNRTQVTEGHRTEIVDLNRTIVIKQNREHLVEQNETIRTNGNRLDTVAGTSDVTVLGDRKTLLASDDHIHVRGSRNELVDVDQSLEVAGNQMEKVGGNHALDATNEIHLKAGMNLVIESGVDLTLKSSGGFIRIDPTGVTIQGTLVRINSGGAAGSGQGSSPVSPTDATAAEITPPEKPIMDDVSETGINQ